MDATVALLESQMETVVKTAVVKTQTLETQLLDSQQRVRMLEQELQQRANPEHHIVTRNRQQNLK